MRQSSYRLQQAQFRPHELEPYALGTREMAWNIREKGLNQCSASLGPRAKFGPRTVFSWPARPSPEVGNIEKTNWEYKFLFVDLMSTESRQNKINVELP